MGYTTDFDGRFEFNKQLDALTWKFLEVFSHSRRMGRKLGPIYGEDGEFYTDDEVTGLADCNKAPISQPGLYCDWAPSDDGCFLEWNSGEKFYNYVPWLAYLIHKIFIPRGYILNGTVRWRGEEFDDTGSIIVEDNEITIDVGGKKTKIEDYKGCESTINELLEGEDRNPPQSVYLKKLHRLVLTAPMPVCTYDEFIETLRKELK